MKAINAIPAITAKKGAPIFSANPPPKMHAPQKYFQFMVYMSSLS